MCLGSLQRVLFHKIKYIQEDIQFLAESAYADACRPGNPRDTSVEEIVELYNKLM